jgi:pSer/pThr/pTyr-binding forkhead associated (FHA) protein
MQRTRAIPVPDADAPQPAESVALVVGSRRIVISGTSPLSVGRSLDNDVIVDGPSVSRRHARLVPRGSHWLLEDLNSTHGTFVNGHRVSASLIRAGDQIRLGSQVAHLRNLEETHDEGNPAASADPAPDEGGGAGPGEPGAETET